MAFIALFQPETNLTERMQAGGFQYSHIHACTAVLFATKKDPMRYY